MKTNKLSKTTIRQAQDALQLLFPTCRFTVAPNGLPGRCVLGARMGVSDMNTVKRGRHSHRCKICRQGVYCYKGGCTLPQRLDACAECRRTGRYVAPVRSLETIARVETVPALKGWLAGLPDATREAVFVIMRDMDAKADRANERHAQLRPRYGEIAVGGAHMDPFFESEGLRGMLRGLREGMTPSDARTAGNDAANYAIEHWNATREWQVHRAKDSERSALEYQMSRLQLATQKGGTE